jgi:hypothetical protein
MRKLKKLYKERHVYFFDCSNCEQRSQSFKKSIALKKLCRNCRSGKIVNRNQTSIFEGGDKRL